MSCHRTCLKGAAVIGLIAALTPVVAAQSLQPKHTVKSPGGTDAPRSLTEVQQAATARRAMRGDKVSPGIGTTAPPTAPAQGGLIWFTNQAEFEAFNTGEGKVLKGIEDYEESILDAGGDFFDDPLESGVPNLPDGFPFPDGMTGLPNLIVQSNLGGGDPTDENPRGVDGLQAFAAGVFGAVSDVVVADFFVDSLDLIFTDEKSGVGFNTITLIDGDAVEVRVYSTTNVFLGMMTTPADPSGANFIGVWSSDPIGRINIFNPDNRPEGGDNIQAWEAGPPSELIWFDNQKDFEAFNTGEGKVLKGIEDYEEADLGPGEGVAVDDPLVSGIPNPPVFPDGLTGLPNLQVQSNLSGGNPDEPNPRGIGALAAFAAPGGNFVSDGVIANSFADSLDLIFLTDGKTGVGGNTLRFSGPGSIEMRVYDINNSFLGMMAAPADPAGTNFLGVWSPIPIGRVNLWSPDNGAEGLDNIQAWEAGLPSGVDFFLDADAFELALSKAGKDLKGFEDFSENVLEDDSVFSMDDPLDTNSSNGAFPEGILIDNLTFQSNVGGVDSSEPNPAGVDALALVTTGFAEATADAVLSNFFVNAYDILSGPPAGDNHTALGLSLVTFLGGETVRVDVYDKENNLLGTIEDVPAPVAGGGFLGIVAEEGITIGRVNIWDPGDGAEGVYDVAAYFLNPCPNDLDGSGAVDIGDILAVIVAWGNKGGPEDLDGSGFVDIGDLLIVLSSWGPCE